MKQSGTWQNDAFVGGPMVSQDQVSPPQQQALAAAAECRDFGVWCGSGTRVALIIGNTNYRFASALQNPNNDAQLLAQTLRGAGFQTVMVKTDLDRDGTIRALREFAGVADAADWAVVYYSGHGIEFGGINYMVPVDAQLKVDRDIDSKPSTSARS